MAQRYGDDYLVLGARREVREFREGLSKHVLLKLRVVLGPRPPAGDIGEVSHLGRIVRWMDKRRFPIEGGTERTEIEADHDTDRSWCQQSTSRTIRSLLGHLECVCNCQTLISSTKHVVDTKAWRCA